MAQHPEAHAVGREKERDGGEGAKSNGEDGQSKGEAVGLKAAASTQASGVADRERALFMAWRSAPLSTRNLATSRRP